MRIVQLELFAPPSAAAAATPLNDWGVWVNECVVFATRHGAEWWALFSARFEPTPRMTCLMPSIAGCSWHVASDSREDAHMLAELMVENGVPRSAVKVKRLAQCKRSSS